MTLLCRWEQTYRGVRFAKLSNSTCKSRRTLGPKRWTKQCILKFTADERRYKIVCFQSTEFGSYSRVLNSNLYIRLIGQQRENNRITWIKNTTVCVLLITATATHGPRGHLVGRFRQSYVRQNWQRIAGLHRWPETDKHCLPYSHKKIVLLLVNSVVTDLFKPLSLNLFCSVRFQYQRPDGSTQLSY